MQVWPINGLLLHTLGGSGYLDEIFLFGGVGAIVLVLLLFSWRESSRKKKRSRKKRT